MLLYLEPCYGVGEFLLNSPINHYQNHNFYIYPKVEETSWITYELSDDGISIFVENSLIVSISCTKECIYKGINLIGMQISNFISKYGIMYEEVEEIYLTDDITQKVYEFDKICLQIWCQDNVIVNIIASSD